MGMKFCTVKLFQDETRKLLVNSIASNIYENLKQNGDVKQILNLVLKKDKRGDMLQDLADSMVLRGTKLEIYQLYKILLAK